MFDLCGKRFVDGQQHHFEVQAKRSVIHIGTADGADFAVNQHHFLMQKTGLVTEDPHACPNGFEGIQAGRGVYDFVIGTRWNQDAHIHAS